MPAVNRTCPFKLQQALLAGGQAAQELHGAYHCEYQNDENQKRREVKPVRPFPGKSKTHAL